MTRHDELPPAWQYVYHCVKIDLGRCLAIHQGGCETPLVGQVHGLLALLLDHPGRVHTYRQLARVLMPAFARRRSRGPDDLDPQQHEAMKRAMQTLVYRTRLALGERPGAPSIVVNRENIGYAIQRPLRVLHDEPLEVVTTSLIEAASGPALWPVSKREST